MKNNLKKVIGRAYLTYDELFTCIVEIESIVNARPLCYLYDDGEGASYALNPSHLLHGRNISMLPSDRHFEIVSTHESLTKRAKHQIKVLDQFTRRWKTDYLMSLLENRAVDRTESEPIKVDDVVLLKDDNTSPIFWKLAVVQRVNQGKGRTCEKCKGKGF